MRAAVAAAPPSPPGAPGSAGRPGRLKPGPAVEVEVGADSDGAGPKSSASNLRSRPSGCADSGAATDSGSQISAVRPPDCACRSRTRTPCLAARRPTTNRPMRRETATSTTGGLSSRQFACAISCSEMPTPLSVMSSSTPPLVSGWPVTYT